MITIGIVAEGGTDCVVIEGFIRRWIEDKAAGVGVRFRMIYPEIDATSGHYGRGGWTFVREWCRNNNPTTRTAQIFNPLFSTDSPCNILVVHLDGDVPIEAFQDVDGCDLGQPISSEQRGTNIRRALETWLWPDRRLKKPANFASAHLLVTPILNTDTWLVAALDRTIRSPEEMDPETELMRLKPEFQRFNRGRMRIRKTVARWRDLTVHACEHLSHVANSCPHCERFFDDLEERVNT